MQCCKSLYSRYNNNCCSNENTKNNDDDCRSKSKRFICVKLNNKLNKMFGKCCNKKFVCPTNDFRQVRLVIEDLILD